MELSTWEARHFMQTVERASDLQARYLNQELGYPSSAERIAARVSEAIGEAGYSVSSALERVSGDLALVGGSIASLVGLNAEYLPQILSGVMASHQVALDVRDLLASPRATQAAECARRGFRASSEAWWPEAVDEFHRSLESDPYLASSWIGLSHACLQIGRSEEAATAMARAVRYSPGQPGAFVAGLAIVAARLAVSAGDADLAAEVLDGALDRVPSCADLWLAKFAETGSAEDLAHALVIRPSVEAAAEMLRAGDHQIAEGGRIAVAWRWKKEWKTIRDAFRVPASQIAALHATLGVHPLATVDADPSDDVLALATAIHTLLEESVVAAFTLWRYVSAWDEWDDWMSEEPQDPGEFDEPFPRKTVTSLLNPRMRDLYDEMLAEWRDRRDSHWESLKEFERSHPEWAARRPPSPPENPHYDQCDSALIALRAAQAAALRVRLAHPVDVVAFTADDASAASVTTPLLSGTEAGRSLEAARLLQRFVQCDCGSLGTPSELGECGACGQPVGLPPTGTLISDEDLRYYESCGGDLSEEMIAAVLESGGSIPRARLAFRLGRYRDFVAASCA